MSREFKFRAWDKLGEKFFDTNSFFQQHYIISLNGKFANLANGSGGNEFVIQQYTGIKDKDGNEIYEGDILISLNDIRYIVKFTDGSFVLSFKNGNHTISQLLCDSWKMTITGNIFENSELCGV